MIPALRGMSSYRNGEPLDADFGDRHLRERQLLGLAVKDGAMDAQIAYEEGRLIEAAQDAKRRARMRALGVRA